MTGLMNSVSNNNIPSFIYFFFEEECSLNNVDINGNTILHLAAKSNSISIAKILRHIYEDMKTNKHSRFIKKHTL
jgi:Ankyrin repeat